MEIINRFLRVLKDGLTELLKGVWMGRADCLDNIKEN